jgi:hypothetical protein
VRTSEEGGSPAAAPHCPVCALSVHTLTHTGAQSARGREPFLTLKPAFAACTPGSVHVNKRTAVKRPDGVSVAVAVAHKDPGVPGEERDWGRTFFAWLCGGGLSPRESAMAPLPHSQTFLHSPFLCLRSQGVNHLETAHHAHGTMALRWVLAADHPVPRCRLIKLDEVDKSLAA